MNIKGVIAAIAVLIFIPVISQETSAQEITFAKPGTELLWGKIDDSNTGIEIIGPSKGYMISATWNGKRGRKLFPFCYFCKVVDYEIDADKLNPFFPLAVGKSTTYERLKRGNIWIDTVEVLGKETLVTPAGTFETFVIETRSKSKIGFWSGTKKRYFSPKLGWTVRADVNDSEGKDYKWHVLSINGKRDVTY